MLGRRNFPTLECWDMQFAIVFAVATPTGLLNSTQRCPFGPLAFGWRLEYERGDAIMGDEVFIDGTVFRGNIWCLNAFYL